MLQKVFLRRDPNEPEPKEMDLGQSGGFHYDKSKGRWVIDGEQDQGEDDSRPPPSASRSVGPSTKTRGRYFDPLAATEPAAAPFRPAGGGDGPASDQKPTAKEEAKSEEVIRSYEAQVMQEELTKKVETLQATIAALKSDHSDSVEHFQVKKDELEAQIDLLNTAKAKAYMSIRELEFDLKSEREESTSLQREIAAFKAEMQAKDREVLALRLSARSSSSDLATTGESVEELQFRLAQSDTEKVNLMRILAEKDGKVSELRDQTDALTEESVGLRREVERTKHDAQLSIHFHEEENARQCEVLARTRTDLSRVRELHKQATEQLERHSSLKEEFELRVGILSQAKSRADVELKRAIFERIQAENDADCYSRQVKDLQGRLRALEEQQDRSRLQEYEADGDMEAMLEARMEMQRVEGEKLALREELISMRRKHDELEDRLSATFYANQQICEENKAAKAQLRQSEDGKAAIATELETTRQKLGQVTKSYEQVLGEKTEVEAKWSEELGKRKLEEERGRELEELRERIEESEQKCKETEAILTNLQGSFASLEGNLQNSEQERAKLSEKLSEAEAESSELAERLSSLQAEFGSLQEESQKLSENLRETEEELRKETSMRRDEAEFTEKGRLEEAESRAEMAVEELRTWKIRLWDAREGSRANFERLSCSESAYSSLISDFRRISEANSYSELSLSSAKSEISLLSDRISQLEASLEEAKSALAEKALGLEICEGQKQELGEEKAALQEAISRYEETIYDMRTAEMSREENSAEEVGRLREEVEERKAAEETLSAQVERLRAEARDAVEVAEDVAVRETKLQSECVQLRHELQSLRSISLEQEDALSELKFQKHQLDAELAQSQDRCNRLNEELVEGKQTAREQKASYEARVRDLQTDLAKAEESLSQYLQEIEDMRSAMEEASRARDEEELSYQRQMEQAQKEVEDLNTEIAEGREAAEKKNSENESLQGEIEHLNRQIEQLVNKSQEATAEFEQKQRELASKNAELTSITAEKEQEIIRLLREIAVLHEEKTDVAASMSGVQSKSEEFQAETRRLQSELQRTLQEKEELVAEVRESAEKTGRLEAEIETISSENQALRDELQAQVTKAKSREFEGKEGKTRLERLQTECSSLKLSLSSLEGEKADLSSALSLASDQVSSLRSSVSVLETEKSRLEKATSGHKAAVESLKKKYEELIKKDRETAQKAFEQQDAALASKDALISSLRSQLDSRQKPAPELEAGRNASELQRENEELERKVAELNENVEKLYEKNFELQQEIAVSQNLAKEKQQLLEEIKEMKEKESGRMEESLKRREEEITILRQELLSAMEHLSSPQLPSEAPIEEPQVTPPLPAAPPEKPETSSGWVTGFLSKVFLTEKEQAY